MADEAENTSDTAGSHDPAPAGVPARGGPQPPKPPTKIWRPWAIALSALLALLFSLLLLVGDGLAGVLNNLGGPQSVSTWLRVAAFGHGVLALTSVVLLFVGLSKPSRCRPAALVAWAIIPVGIGWFFLCGRLAAA